MNERQFTHSAWRLKRAQLRLDGATWLEVDKAGHDFMVANPNAWLNWGPIHYDEYQSEDTVYIVGYTRAKMLGEELWRFAPFGWHLASNEPQRMDWHPMNLHRRKSVPPVSPGGYTMFTQGKVRFFAVDGRLFYVSGNPRVGNWRMEDERGGTYPDMNFQVVPLGYAEDYPDVEVPDSDGVFHNGKKLAHDYEIIRKYAAQDYDIVPNYGELVKERYWPK